MEGEDELMYRLGWMKMRVLESTSRELDLQCPRPFVQQQHVLCLEEVDRDRYIGGLASAYHLRHSLFQEIQQVQQ